MIFFHEILREKTFESWIRGVGWVWGPLWRKKSQKIVFFWLLPLRENVNFTFYLSDPGISGVQYLGPDLSLCGRRYQLNTNWYRGICNQCLWCHLVAKMCYCSKTIIQQGHFSGVILSLASNCSRCQIAKLSASQNKSWVALSFLVVCSFVRSSVRPQW